MPTNPAEVLDGAARALYVKTGSAPTDPSKITGYTRAALLTSLSLSGERGEVTLATFDDYTADGASWESSADGVASYSIEVGAYVPKDETGSAQDMLEDAYLTRDTVVHWLITDNVTGHVQRHGRASVRSVQPHGGQFESKAEFTATLRGQGAYAKSVVA